MLVLLSQSQAEVRVRNRNLESHNVADWIARAHPAWWAASKARRKCATQTICRSMTRSRTEPVAEPGGEPVAEKYCWERCVGPGAQEGFGQRVDAGDALGTEPWTPFR